MDFLPANLEEKFSLFEEYWTPKIIGELNGQYLKVAKLKGEFLAHTHDHEDELFYIVKGKLTLKFSEQQEVKLEQGELYIVPAGVEHLPVAEEECWVLLMEPKSTTHTGSTNSEKTIAIEDQEWI